jgi:hypothetical protein
MTMPVTTVEIAFASQPEDTSPVWVDVTQWVRSVSGIAITRGRQDQYDQTQPSRLTLSLLNPGGRFTPGNVSSPYYPNVKRGRRIRVSETHNGVTYRRFTGFVDEWPVTWADASASVSYVDITASSRMARLGRAKTLQSIIGSEYLQDNPVAYYPLGEPEGALKAGNVSTTAQPNMAVTAVGAGSTGNITFGDSTGPGTDGLTAALFTRVSATAGANLVMTSPAVISQGVPVAGSVLLEAWFLTSTTAEMGIAAATAAPDASGFAWYAIALGVSATGKLTGIQSRGTPGSSEFSLASAATVSDGLTHHAALRVTDTTGDTVATLFLDGAVVASTTLTGAFWRYDLQRLIGGGGIVNSCYAGTLSHVAIYDTPGTEISNARIQQHYLAGSTGFSGERSDQRITRLARYAGMPSSDVTVETGLSTSIINQDTTGQTPLSLMQDVTSTENGVLFDSGDGKLTFHARSHRYNVASSLTLYAGGLLTGLEPRLDDQGLVNDISASRPNGVSVRSVDAASVSEYGLYREEIQLLTTDDNEVFDAASWKVYVASTPQVRVPTAGVLLNLANTAQATAILSLEIGDRITLANLPSQAPAASMDFFIEGWTETITADDYRIAFNLSPASLSGVWQLDSSVYSVLGTSTRLGY